MCMCDALANHNTRVFVTKTLLGYGLLPRVRGNLEVSRYSPRDFGLHLLRNAAKIGIFVNFSADYFKGERYVYKALRLCRFPKAIVPAGNAIARVDRNYDHILWEADNAASYGFGGDPRNFLLRPAAVHPGNVPADFPRFVPSEDFYLTVFNDYNSGLKGTRFLYDVAVRSRRPIIWCTALRPLPDGVPGKLYPMAASRNAISMLLKVCRAYLSVSTAEGFGWSLFEAMTHQRPILSRAVGVPPRQNSCRPDRNR